LIDDDNDFRTALAANLRDDGHQVLEAPTPETVAAEHWRRAHLLIACDHSVMLLDRLHREHPAAPIIMITTLRTDLLDRAAVSRPFLTVISKPLDYGELHEVIEAKLRR
jgi:DNA-binding response OmpR family regulator